MKFSFFSFQWLSSEERKLKKQELELKKEELLLKEKRLNKEEPEVLQKEFMEQVLTAPTKPFKSVRVIGKTCMVVLNDGTTLSKDDPELLGKVRQAQNEEDIIELFCKTESVKEDEEETKLVAGNLDILKGHEDFVVEGDRVKMKGVNLWIPPIVLASFIELLEKMETVWDDSEDGCISCEIDELEEQYQALKAFWLKLCLNGREQSRQDLLSFCKENDVKITKNGNLVLYRNLVSTKNTDSAYTKFVSQQYFKIKSFKKSPSNYEVVDNNGKFELINHKGNTNDFKSLAESYKSLPKEVGNVFTSWNNKGKYKIKIGEIYKIDENDINLDNGVCHGGGLHCAWVGYDYSSYGDTPVVVLVSPSKAITVPLSDRGKLRTTEMFVAAINDKPIGEHFSEEDLSAFDEEYNHLSIQELEEGLKSKSFSAISVKNEVSPLTPVDMENVKEMLKSRIISI